MTITGNFFPFYTAGGFLQQRSCLDVFPLTNTTHSFCNASNNQVDFYNLIFPRQLGFAGAKMLIEYLCLFEIKGSKCITARICFLFPHRH